MKEKVEKLNHLIAERRERLKEKAERYFDSILIPSESSFKSSSQNMKSNNTPPVSMILYGMAALSTIGIVVTESKLLCLGLAAVSAYGGYKISSDVNKKTAESSSLENLDMRSLKTEINSKLIDAVQKINQEWEEFMELKQKEMRLSISSSSLDEGRKSSLISKIYLYEIIDIKLSGFSDQLSNVSNPTELKKNLSLYKKKCLSAIDKAAESQIAKYNSLLE